MRRCLFGVWLAGCAAMLVGCGGSGGNAPGSTQTPQQSSQTSTVPEIVALKAALTPGTLRVSLAWSPDSEGVAEAVLVERELPDLVSSFVGEANGLLEGEYQFWLRYDVVLQSGTVVTIAQTEAQFASISANGAPSLYFDAQSISTAFDNDGDNNLNIDEIIDGTDPNDAADFLLARVERRTPYAGVALVNSAAGELTISGKLSPAEEVAQFEINDQSVAFNAVDGIWSANVGLALGSNAFDFIATRNGTTQSVATLEVRNAGPRLSRILDAAFLRAQNRLVILDEQLGLVALNKVANTREIVAVIESAHRVAVDDTGNGTAYVIAQDAVLEQISLFEVNMGDGSVTPVPLNGDVPGSVTAVVDMALGNDQLLLIDSSTDPNTLVLIDINTGDANIFGELGDDHGPIEQFFALSYSQRNDDFIAVAQNSLYTINASFRNNNRGDRDIISGANVGGGDNFPAFSFAAVDDARNDNIAVAFLTGTELQLFIVDHDEGERQRVFSGTTPMTSLASVDARSTQDIIVTSGLDRVEEYDVGDDTSSSFIVSRLGAGPNLGTVSDVMLDIDDTLIAADADRQSLVAIDTENGNRSDITALNSPALALLSGKILAIDTQNQAIVSIGANGSILSGNGVGDGPEFASANLVDLAADEIGRRVFVADNANGRVVAVSYPSGTRSVLPAQVDNVRRIAYAGGKIYALRDAQIDVFDVDSAIVSVLSQQGDNAPNDFTGEILDVAADATGVYVTTAGDALQAAATFRIDPLTGERTSHCTAKPGSLGAAILVAPATVLTAGSYHGVGEVSVCDTTLATSEQLIISR